MASYTSAWRNAVRERVGLGDEHLVRDRVAEALVQLGFGDVGDRGDEPVVGGAADDRRATRSARCAGSESASTRGEHDVAQRARAACRRRAPRPRAAPRRRTRCRPSVRTFGDERPASGTSPRMAAISSAISSRSKRGRSTR